MKTNKELQLAHDLIEFTGTSIYLTGKAGTGKTTFMHNLKLKSPKRMIVLAPTGVAAINAGGVTIHSFFQLPFCPHIPNLLYQDENGNYAQTNKFGNQQQRTASHYYGKDKIKIIRSVDLIVIDEISMVRADILDAVDEILKRYRRNDKPFGGIQMLFIGDIKQLAPVAKEEEWSLLEKYYDSPYFFSSLAFKKARFLTIELKEIFRQEDKKFIDLLNKIRNKQLDNESIELLNQRYNPAFSNGNDEGYITLTTHNYQAKSINDQKLSEIDQPEQTFYAEIKGDFPEYSYPTDEELTLKVGAQVMFVKNDPSPEKRYFNGKIGVIEDIYENKIYIRCKDDDEAIPLQQLEWTNVKYAIDTETNEIFEDILGTFKQYPLKLAWAITIHKSQGLTFEKLAVDAQQAFAHGQVYVALSRCKTLEGLVLISKISQHTLKQDYSVMAFEDEMENMKANDEKLLDLRREYFFELLADLFDFKQLHIYLKRLQKISYQHIYNIFPKYIEKLSAVSRQLQTEVIAVSEKFFHQLKQSVLSSSDYETNPFLIDRYTKASEYFGNKLEEIIQPFTEIEIDIDNKEASKVITKAQEEFVSEYQSKKLLLSHIFTEKFEIQSFLKAKADIELRAKESKKKTSTKKVSKKDSNNDSKKDYEYSDIKHPKLYGMLKEWRMAEATLNNVKPYNIFIQKALLEMCVVLPETKDALLNIHGIGKVTLEKYGDEILEIIKEYIDEYGR